MLLYGCTYNIMSFSSEDTWRNLTVTKKTVKQYVPCSKILQMYLWQLAHFERKANLANKRRWSIEHHISSNLNAKLISARWAHSAPIASGHRHPGEKLSLIFWWKFPAGSNITRSQRGFTADTVQLIFSTKRRVIAGWRHNNLLFISDRTWHCCN